MSLQVGALGYADAVAAAQAACSGHVPSATVAGGNVVQLSCVGTTTAGAMQMQTLVAPVDGSASAVATTLEMTPTFGPCVWGDYVVAWETIFVAVLLAWVGWYGVKKVNDMITWGRGSHEGP